MGRKGFAGSFSLPNPLFDDPGDYAYPKIKQQIFRGTVVDPNTRAILFLLDLLFRYRHTENEANCSTAGPLLT